MSPQRGLKEPLIGPNIFYWYLMPWVCWWLKNQEVNVVPWQDGWAPTKTLPRASIFVHPWWNFVKIMSLLSESQSFSPIRTETFVTGSPNLAATTSWQAGWWGNWLFQISGQTQWFWACSWQIHQIDLKLGTHDYKLCSVSCIKFDVNQTRNKTMGLKIWTTQPFIPQL